MNDFNIELEKIMYELNLFRKVECSSEESEKFTTALKNNEKLPEDIQYHTSSNFTYFWRNIKYEMTSEEIIKSVVFRQTLYLKSIMKNMKFFVMLTIVSIITTFIFFFKFF